MSEGFSAFTAIYGMLEDVSTSDFLISEGIRILNPLSLIIAFILIICIAIFAIRILRVSRRSLGGGR